MKKKKSFDEITAEELRLLFLYDPYSGKLISKKTGFEVGYDNGFGYIRTTVYGIKVLVHRIIWKMEYGTLPDKDIDHINGNRRDNRLCNLRLATRGENLQNSKTYKGYWWSKVANKWASAIKVNYKSIHLGYFEDEKDARKAYMEAKKKYHPFSVEEAYEQAKNSPH